MPFPLSFRLQATSPTYGLGFIHQAQAIFAPLRAALGADGQVHASVTDAIASLEWQQSLVDQFTRATGDPYRLVTGAQIRLTPVPSGLAFDATVQQHSLAGLATVLVAGGLILGFRGDLRGLILAVTTLAAWVVVFLWVRQRVTPWFVTFLLAPVEVASTGAPPAAT